jgi:hypothetical protein
MKKEPAVPIPQFPGMLGTSMFLKKTINKEMIQFILFDKLVLYG